MLAWHILCYGTVSVYGSVRYKPVFCQNNTKHISTPKQCRTQWRGQRFWSGGIDRDRVWEGFFPPQWGWICGEAMPLPRNYFDYFDFWIKMVHYGPFCALFFLPRDANATYRYSAVYARVWCLSVCHKVTLTRRCFFINATERIITQSTENWRNTPLSHHWIIWPVSIAMWQYRGTPFFSSVCAVLP